MLHVDYSIHMYRYIVLSLFIASSAFSQDCKEIIKKTNKDTGVTMYVAIPKGRLLKASDPKELDVLIARKAISSADTVYELWGGSI